MIPGAGLVACAYVALTVALVAWERWRTRAGGPDPISVFVVLFALQCCVAGAGISGVLPYVDAARPTGVQFTDNVFQAADLTVLAAVFALTAAFAAFFYIGCAVGSVAFRWRDPIAAPLWELEVNERRLWVVLVSGAALTMVSFWSLADSMWQRFANLILLRADDPHVVRNALNSNALALTQAWSWLTVIPLFTIPARRGRSVVWSLVLAIAVGFALMGVSRRALFLPLLLGYLALVLSAQRWRVAAVIAAAGPALLWIAFGKSLISTIAYGGTVESALGAYESVASAALRSVSDLGTTVVESIGTLALIDLPPRFGMDHLLSVAQRFPEGILGIEVDWPERMVRISTRAFVSDNHQDVPPGLMGQMWLDFRVLGPVVWGLVLGLQMGIVQRYWERTRRGAQSAVVYAIITFVVALPLNTGSFDFSVGMDIIVLALVLYGCCTLRPISGSVVAGQPEPF